MKGHNTLADSSPCVDCYNKMCELNVRTIVYSSTNGEILKQRLKDYTPKVISLGRQFINNGYNAIYRNKAHERKLFNFSDSITMSSNSSEYDYDIDDDSRSISSNSSIYSSLTNSSTESITDESNKNISKKFTQNKSKRNKKFIMKLIKNKSKYN